MREDEFINDEERLVRYLLESGFVLERTSDYRYPSAKFFLSPAKLILVVVSCAEDSEIKDAKNYFLIDKGLLHCCILAKDRVIFYRRLW